MKLKFEGFSDDTFGEYNVSNIDVDNCGSGTPIRCIVKTKDHGELMVVGQYSDMSKNGCWMIGISNVEEDIPIPDWNISFAKKTKGYSPILTVELPCDSCTMMWYSGNNLKNEIEV